ncbi:MAG TPA: hypothetical protein VIO32_04125 [Candidatus Baltobacteraceae bacterium]
MKRMPLSTRNVFTVTFLCLLSACGAASTHAALAPTPLPLDSPDAQALERAKRSGLCGSDFVTAADRVGDKMIVACGEGKLFVLDRAFNELRSTMLRMRVNSVMPAGTRDIAVFGTTDGAVLQAQLALLDAATLRPIVQHDMTDSTFLGVYRGRAYIDDWCCFGRADVYRPATIYSVSLKDGSESPHVDLTPDPQAHPGESQPLGQGESNYRIGNYFYVHVQDVTYRYDLNDLRKPPVRMRSSVPWGPGTSP